MQRRGFMRWMAGAAILTGLLGLAGCSGLTSDDDSIKPYYRVINLLPKQSTIQVDIDDDTVFSSVAFEASSSYAQQDWGSSNTVDVRSSSGSLLGTTTLTAAQDKHYSVYVYPEAGSAGVVAFQDEAYDDFDSSNTFVIRTLTASAVLAGFDLYVTGTSESISSILPTVSGADPASISSYSSELTAGTYRVRLTPIGSKTVLFDSTQAFTAGATYTLALYTRGSSTLPTAMLIKPANGSATVLENSLSRVRVVQGAPDVSATRMQIDGTTTFQSIEFGAATSFVTRAAGDHTFTFLNQSTSSDFASLTATLEGGRDYTLYTKGTSSSASAVMLENYHEPVTSGTVRTTFVNATNDQSSVDAIVNYETQAASLASDTSSDAVELYSSVVYNGYFYASSNSAELSSYTIDTDADDYTYETFESDGDYTIALVGSGGTYATVIFQTN